MLWYLNNRKEPTVNGIYNYPSLFGNITASDINSVAVEPLKNIKCDNYNSTESNFSFTYTPKPYGKHKQTKLIQHFLKKQEQRQYQANQSGVPMYYKWYDKLSYFDLPHQPVKSKSDFNSVKDSKRGNIAKSHTNRWFLKSKTHRRSYVKYYYCYYNQTNVPDKYKPYLRHSHRRSTNPDFRTRDDYEYFRGRRSAGWKNNKHIRHQYQKHLNVKSDAIGNTGDLYAIYSPDLNSETKYFNKRYIADGINNHIDPVTAADMQLSDLETDVNYKNEPISMHDYEKLHYSEIKSGKNSKNKNVNNISASEIKRQKHAKRMLAINCLAGKFALN